MSNDLRIKVMNRVRDLQVLFSLSEFVYFLCICCVFFFLISFTLNTSTQVKEAKISVTDAVLVVKMYECGMINDPLADFVPAGGAAPPPMPAARAAIPVPAPRASAAGSSEDEDIDRMLHGL